MKSRLHVFPRTKLYLFIYFSTLISSSVSCKAEQSLNGIYPMQFSSSPSPSKRHNIFLNLASIIVFENHLYQHTTHLKHHLFQHTYILQTSFPPSNAIKIIEASMKPETKEIQPNSNKASSIIAVSSSSHFQYVTHFMHARNLEMIVFVVANCLLLKDYVDGSYFLIFLLFYLCR